MVTDASGNNGAKARSERARIASEKILKNAPLTREVTKLAIQQYSITHKSRWQIVMFLGPKLQEGNGIVDMLAIRKNTTYEDKKQDINLADLLEIILIDIRGSERKAKKVKEQDILRLIGVANHHHAKNIVHAEFQPNKECKYELKFWELDPSWKDTDPKNKEYKWNPIELKEIFKNTNSMPSK